MGEINHHMSVKPIGIFDSGVGGTSIWKEIHSLMPQENTIYLADSANAPYGNKGRDAIISFSKKNTDYLIKQGCKLIVVACNTATTNAIDFLRKSYDLPFIGIEPAIKPAALNTTSKVVGILATKGTLSSELFSKTSNLFANSIKVIEREGHGIVELIENGKLYSDEMKNLLTQYIAPMIYADIDYLVLGCTHYPYLIPLLSKMLPPHVKIIDSGEAVARQTQAVLKKNNLINNSLKTPRKKFYTNGNPQILASILDNNYDVLKMNF